MPSPPRLPLSSRPTLRAVSWWAAAALLVASVAGFAGVEALVDAGFVEERITRCFSAASPRPSVTVGSVQLLPRRLGFRIHSLRIGSAASTGSRSSGEESPGGGWVITAPRATMTGVGLGSLLRGSLTARKLRIEAPTLVRRAGGGDTGDTTRVAAVRLEVEGVSVQTRGDLQVLRARTVTLDSLDVRVAALLEPDPGTARALPSTPARLLRALEQPSVRVGSLAIRHGRIRYIERRPGQPGSGSILFDRIEGRVQPILAGPALPDRRRGRPGGRDTVELWAGGRAAGSAPIWIAITFPGGDDDLAFEASGGAGRLDLRALNSMFRPVDGLRIEDGRLDSLRFRFRARNGRAEGRVTPVYDDLDLVLEDPRTGGRGLDERFKGFLLGLRLNADNRPDEGDGFRIGRIEREAAPGDTFFAFFWNALLSGLRDAAGL